MPHSPVWPLHASNLRSSASFQDPTVGCFGRTKDSLEALTCPKCVCSTSIHHPCTPKIATTALNLLSVCLAGVVER